MNKIKIQKIVGIIVLLIGILLFFGTLAYSFGYSFIAVNPILSIALICIGVFIYSKAKPKLK